MLLLSPCCLVQASRYQSVDPAPMHAPPSLNSLPNSSLTARNINCTFKVRSGGGSGGDSASLSPGIHECSGMPFLPKKLHPRAFAEGLCTTSGGDGDLVASFPSPSKPVAGLASIAPCWTNIQNTLVKPYHLNRFACLGRTRIL